MLLLILLMLVGPGAKADSCVTQVLALGQPRSILRIARTSPVFSFADLTAKLNSLNIPRVPNFTYAYHHPEKAFVIVSKVSGLSHTYLAVFNSRTYMNWALGSVTYYQTQNEIAPRNVLFRRKAFVQGFSGHDLKGSLVREFLSRLPKKYFTERDGSLRSQIESEFWEGMFLPLLEDDPEAILLAVSLDTSFKKTISHELLHGYFYENLDLQDAVKKFWLENITSEDQKKYVNVLIKESYDVHNEEQLLGEFLAYTLELERPIIFPARLINRYKKPLLDFLIGAGFDLSQFFR